MRKTIKALLESDNESRNIENLLQHVNRGSRVLDVGCGYGEKIHLLNKLGFYNIMGIEKNQNIVKISQSKGLDIIHSDDFDRICSNEQFDLIMFSHIIEHFNYNDLLPFMESYLSLSKNGSLVLIVSPIMSAFFYDDFDHVKPYHPAGIAHVFSGGGRQVQFYSRYKLILKDIYFRRMPFHFFRYSRHNYLGNYNYFIIGINLIASILFRISGSRIGRVTGWSGLYSVHY